MIRLLRMVVMALLGSLIFGLIVGTVIRMKLDRPTYYLGISRPFEPIACHNRARLAGTLQMDVCVLAVAADPLGFRASRPMVFETRQDEEQIG
jgi:hypothetical protein